MRRGPRHAGARAQDSSTPWLALAIAAALAVAASGLATRPAGAQPPPDEPGIPLPPPGDSLFVGSAGDTAIVRREAAGPGFRYDPGPDRDRFEIGASAVQGYFDATGTLAYRRYLRYRRNWIQSIQGELSGANKSYLTEGAVSAIYFFRHRQLDRPGWRVRPVLEGGPGAHLVVQGAHIQGMNETSYHVRAFLKGHVYAGVELLASPRVGFLLRGRMSIPNHRPLDYAQAAIFFR